VVARGMVTELHHPVIGDMKTIGPPTKFSAMDYSVRGPAPWLGQHTAEVLREIGTSEEDIAALFADEVVFDARPHLHDRTNDEA
jgi:crotonobetainyl-CoA:carnitine CoA-transferase CaiB-like acyl-CoA transferase